MQRSSPWFWVTPYREAWRNSMTAGDLMTPDPTIVVPEASVAEAWDLMRDLDIRHLPVVEGRTLVGMVSDRDFGRMGMDMAGILASEGADALREELATPVVKIMSADVIWVDTETDLGDVVSLLIEHKVGALPIVSPGTRDVVGILSYIDVLKVLQSSLRDDD
jgi:CBS domain-containing protein